MALTREGYTVLSAERGDVVVDRVLRENPDLVLLDVILPVENGFEICRELRRRNSRIPIIMMSADRTEEIDRIVGLEIGADDYVLKPFGVRELVARVGACLRRNSRTIPSCENYEFDDVMIDANTREVKRAGQAVKLTAKEFDLLVCLIRHGGHVVTREELLHLVWGYNGDLTTRTVDTHILSLRKKLEVDPGSPRHLLSERGSGYRFI